MSPIIAYNRIMKGGRKMYTNELEGAYSDFLETRDFDYAESFLFSVLRSAFIAGWKAAGGRATEASPVKGKEKEN